MLYFISLLAHKVVITGLEYVSLDNTVHTYSTTTVQHKQHCK